MWCIVDHALRIPSGSGSSFISTTCYLRMKIFHNFPQNEFLSLKLMFHSRTKSLEVKIIVPPNSNVPASGNGHGYGWRHGVQNYFVIVIAPFNKTQVVVKNFWWEIKAILLGVRDK